MYRTSAEEKEYASLQNLKMKSMKKVTGGSTRVYYHDGKRVTKDKYDTLQKRKSILGTKRSGPVKAVVVDEDNTMVGYIEKSGKIVSTEMPDEFRSASSGGSPIPKPVFMKVSPQKSRSRTPSPVKLSIPPPPPLLIPRVSDQKIVKIVKKSPNKDVSSLLLHIRGFDKTKLAPTTRQQAYKSEAGLIEQKLLQKFKNIKSRSSSSSSASFDLGADSMIYNPEQKLKENIATLQATLRDRLQMKKQIEGPEQIQKLEKNIEQLRKTIDAEREKLKKEQSKTGAVRQAEKQWEQLQANISNIAKKSSPSFSSGGSGWSV